MMDCGHPNVVITGAGEGGCLCCHRKVVVKYVQVIDSNFIPPTSVPTPIWVLKEEENRGSTIPK